MNAFSTICLDVGSCYTRIGPCGDDMPRKQFFTEVDSGTGEVGYSCERKDAEKAVQKGHVVDTNAMEKIWEYSVNSMRQFCNPNVNPGVLVNFRPDTTNIEKKHLAEFMFEALEYLNF
jgi:actin-related protein